MNALLRVHLCNNVHKNLNVVRHKDSHFQNAENEDQTLQKVSKSKHTKTLVWEKCFSSLRGVVDAVLVERWREINSPSPKLMN